MNHLIQLIYISSANELMSEAELVPLLETARAENSKHDITGLLLYKDGNIMQVIEGEPADVEQLFENIKLDPRHAGIIVLIKEAIEKRYFADWLMGYRNVAKDKIDGFSDFLSYGSSTADNKITAGKAKKLLMSFRGSTGL